MSIVQFDHVRQRLSKEYWNGAKGIWEIYGEDPNPDLGGAHIKPLLDTVDGVYEDVVEYALQLPNFFSWGRGGDIRLKIEEPPVYKKIPKKYGTVKELEQKRDQLKKELATVERKLSELR